MAPMMRGFGTRALWVGGALVLAPGCLSGARNIGAATTPVGTTEVGVSLNALAFERGREQAYLPSPELTFRKGAGENWDWGGRLTLLGLELGTRHRLIEESRWTWSVAPSAGIWYVPVTNNYTEPVNLRLGAQTLLDYRLSRAWTLTGGAIADGRLRGTAHRLSRAVQWREPVARTGRFTGHRVSLEPLLRSASRGGPRVSPGPEGWEPPARRLYRADVPLEPCRPSMTVHAPPGPPGAALVARASTHCMLVTTCV